MKRTPLYSSMRRPAGENVGAQVAIPPVSPAAVGTPPWHARVRSWAGRHEKLGIFAAGGLLALTLMLLLRATSPGSPALTQEDIDAAVLHTLETKTLPSRPAKAAELVRRSVVRVQGYEHEQAQPAKPERAVPRDQVRPGPQERPSRRASPPPGKDDGSEKPGPQPEAQEGSVGSGVVIVDDGTILTNLHVVAGARRLVVTFFDGAQSEATVLSVQPDKDLAVIKPKTIPDDLPAATLGSTANLQPGDDVVAVGFPFGIGPSVSSGVVSGLNRAFLSPQGKQELSGLIQFDAAANPGNSGGPLISMDGEVVGIVTAILNPTDARTFIGIGFATTIESAGAAVGMPPF